MKKGSGPGGLLPCRQAGNDLTSMATATALPAMVPLQKAAQLYS